MVKITPIMYKGYQIDKVTYHDGPKNRLYMRFDVEYDGLMKRFLSIEEAKTYVDYIRKQNK